MEVEGDGYHHPFSMIADNAPVSTQIVDFQSYLEINDALAVISGESVGKSEGYDIHEIKNEIAFVLKTAPTFGQWFRMPTMRTEMGFAAIPYYEWWAYYLESNEDVTDLSITRVSWTTRFNYWNFEENKSVEYYSDNKSIVQYQVMQTKYYFDEYSREVVECYIYSVAVDNTIRGKHNANINDYKPLNIQYLKNIKDTALIKYQIRLSEYYQSPQVDEKTGNHLSGRDIRGLNPNGSTFDLFKMDYSGINDVNVLRVTGELPVPNGVKDKPQTTGIAFYAKKDELVQLYISTHDYLDIYSSTGEYIDYSNWGYFIRAGQDFVNIKDAFTSRGAFNRINVDYTESNSNYNVARAIRHYDTGVGNEEDLIQKVYKRTAELAGDIGVSDNDINSFIEEMLVYNSVQTNAGVAEKKLDIFIDKVRTAAVEEFILIKNWELIYRGSAAAKDLADIKGEFYQKDLPIGYLIGSVSMNYSVNFSGRADAILVGGGWLKGNSILANEILNNKEYFSLSVALVSNSGDTLIVSSQYDHTYSSLDMLDYYGDFTLNDIILNKKGIYVLKWVITKKINGDEVIVFDTNVPIDVYRFAPISTINNYIVTCDSKTLRVEYK